jgi:hypothetical protein
MILPAKTRRANVWRQVAYSSLLWPVLTCNRKHVMKDLQPYVCIYNLCPTQDILYDCEAAWLKHEQWEHAYQWCCDSPDHPLAMFPGTDEFKNHMREAHPETFQEHQLQGLADASKRPSLAAFEFCPLCGVTSESLGNSQASGEASILDAQALAVQATIQTKDERFVTTKALEDLQKHVARHLWLSAMIALPGRDDLDKAKSVSNAGSQKAKSDTFDIFDTPIDELEPYPFIEEFEEPAELPLSDTELLWERVFSEVLGDRYGEELGLEKVLVLAWPRDGFQPEKSDDTASEAFEGWTKLQILSAFLEELSGYMNPGEQEPPDRGLDVTDLDFVGESEEEDSQDEDKRRHWRVSNFLGDQPAEHDMTGQDPVKRSRSPRASAMSLNIPGPPSLGSTISQPPVRTACYPCNEDFMGRDSDLANLYKILSVPGRLCIVSGTEGMGRTETAVEFTYRYEQTFNCIFWVQAATRVGLADTYSLIATQLGLAPEGTDQERTVELSRIFLDKTEKRWLLVFDNVDNWTDIEDYLPEKTSRTRGSILITTCKTDLAPSPIPVNYYKINLKELRMEEGRSLLIKGLRPDLKHEHLQQHPEYRIAGEIAAFTGLPLAILHISGFVKASGCTLAEFWELWNEWSRNNLPASATNYILNSNSVLETIWDIGLRKLGVDALKVLKIMAFLNSDAIQNELLVNDDTTLSLALLNSSQTHQ